MPLPPLSRRAVLGLLAGSVSPALASPVADLALVLAIDVSFSVDAFEFQLQMQGTGQAFLAPEILEAVGRGARKRIAVSSFLWSDPLSQFVLVPWQLLAGPQDARAIAEVFLRTPRDVPRGTTATGSALQFAQSLLQTAPPTFRHVIDISTDGECNEGPEAPKARDAILALGTTINGLAITKDIPDLDDYLQSNVIGGDQSFVVKANDFEDYGRALRQKLFREITGADII
jgi:Protein of unknown function (DUF1194)